MDEKDKETQAPELEEEQTSETNEETSETNEETPEDKTSEKIKTLDAQKKHWREKAVDKETGKTYKELYEASKESKPDSNINKPTEPDYAKMAFLAQKGIEHPDDVKVVQDEAERLKLPLTDILGMEHIQSRLTANKEARDAKAGLPKGTRRTGAVGQKDVDYWIAKGETPEGDQELAEKVIEARLKKEESGNKFSDQLYT